MPRRVSAILILAAGLVHLGIFFSGPTVAVTVLVFGLLYMLAGIIQWRGIRSGSWMTILFVLMGVGSGIYAVVVKGVQAPDFAAQLLLIEVAAALTSAVHLHQTSSGRLHS